MKFKLLHSSNVIGLDSYLNTKNVNEAFLEAFQKLSQSIPNEKVMDWEIEFTCYYTHGADIKVFKSTKPYVKEKQKRVVIHVPIPTKDIVEWGVEASQHISMNYPASMEKYYTSLEVDFHHSTTLLQHVISCTNRGISFALSDGINILGNKIKIQVQILD